jgi:hypothetical protein
MMAAAMSKQARIRLVLVLIVVVIAVLRYPAVRWFVLISVFIGGVVAVILHFVNKRPVKLESDEVRLHLLDDDDKPEVKQ